MKIPQGRAQLMKVLAASGDVVHISDVAQALAVSRTDAAKRLARWREQGWISRVGAGAYVPASIDTLGSDRVLDDGWVLVPALFSPAYIAGRTAAEHWDLTEQIFKDIVVITCLLYTSRPRSHPRNRSGRIRRHRWLHHPRLRRSPHARPAPAFRPRLGQSRARCGGCRHG